MTDAFGVKMWRQQTLPWFLVMNWCLATCSLPAVVPP